MKPQTPKARAMRNDSKEFKDWFVDSRAHVKHIADMKRAGHRADRRYLGFECDDLLPMDDEPVITYVPAGPETDPEYDEYDRYSDDDWMDDDSYNENDDLFDSSEYDCHICGKPWGH